MVFPKARLVVAAALFLGWIGYLAYLVARTRDPVILSRPQLEVSSLVIRATVQEKNGRPVPLVAVKKVEWALAKEDVRLAESRLLIDGLEDCASAQGWTGPGEYIIPLTKRSKDGIIEVTPIPASPGYRPKFVALEIVKVGPDKDKVEQIIHGIQGADREAAPGIVRRNIPLPEVEELKKKLDAAHAVVRFSESESRIYRVTPDALEQLATVAGNRK